MQYYETSSYRMLFQYAVSLCHTVSDLFTAFFPPHNHQLSFIPLSMAYRILLLINISNLRRLFCILKVAFLDSRVGGGQGELVLEAFLNCIFGAEQPPRNSRACVWRLLCMKVLHCMRQFLNCQAFTGFLNVYLHVY